MEKATFAGGCFWCTQHHFDELAGVVKTTVGYTGGHTQNPDYQSVCSGKTGHVEAIEIEYDPEKISYTKLLETFWHQIDPTVKNQQFFDRGSQYQTVIFYHNGEQKRAAEDSLVKLKSHFSQIGTEIKPACPFYPAEEYHQCFYKKSPIRYENYVKASAREERLSDIWK